MDCLLKHGADVDAKTVNNWTPLLVATYNGHLNVVETLINYKADLNAATLNCSWSPLHLAARYIKILRVDSQAILISNGFISDKDILK